MRRIDAHLHLWDPARGDYSWLKPQMTRLYRRFDAHDAKPLLDAADVEGVILVQAAPTAAETDYLLEIAQSVPWVLGVVGWVDFDADDAIEAISRRSRHPKLVGLRPMLQDIPDPEWILDPRRAGCLRAMERHGLVLDALVRTSHLRAITQLAAAYPQLAIVIDHAAKPAVGASIDPSWADAMQRVSKLGNVGCKLSGLLTELTPGTDPSSIVQHAELLLAMFRPDRLLWGSDWPVLTAAATYTEWLDLTQRSLSRLDSPDLHAVMGLNALRIYGLGAH
jgi:L-fuconolactonase